MSGATEPRYTERFNTSPHRSSVISPRRLKRGSTWRTSFDEKAGQLFESPNSVSPDPVDFFRTPVSLLPVVVKEDTMPLQIWEGVVQSVDKEEGVMHVILNAKMGEVPRHSADIDMQWVSEQDKNLVEPGAVFYLTLFKLTKKGGSIQNAQELRFRRRPSWSASQLRDIENGVAELHSKMKELPTAE